VPRFEPFRGIRYDTTRVNLDDVVAPPYDVIGPGEQSALEARSPFNAVQVELARDTEGESRYEMAARRFDRWIDENVLRADPEPAFYVYRMGFHDETGTPRQTTGVVGALELSVPGDGQVLPHERTIRKARDDRLSLLGACRANLSPVWCLSLAPGLSELCHVTRPPVARCTDDDGVHHRLWPVTEAGVVEAMTSVVASAPAVIADGHHRYETALAYRDDMRTAGAGAGDHDLIMAYLVELADEQLSVRPIHRLLSGLPDGFDLVGALAGTFEILEVGAPDGSLPARMASEGALALVSAGRAWLLRPRPDVDGQGDEATDADSALVATSLADLPPHQLSFHHRVDHVLTMVDKGEAQAGLLLRPVTVSEISRVAWANGRMPEKTTFFQPKPRTGMVFRRLEAPEKA